MNNRPSTYCISLSQPVGEQDHVPCPTRFDVTLIEYGDFERPYSREGTRIARILLESFRDRLRVEFRHFVLTEPPIADMAVWVEQHAVKRPLIEIIRWNNELRDMRLSEIDEHAQEYLEEYIEAIGQIPIK